MKVAPVPKPNAERSAKAPSTLVVRAAGLAAWGMIGVQIALAPNTHVYRASFAQAVVHVLHLVFGAAFWANTGRIQGPSPTRASVVLLALQAVIALFISTDLLMLVALEMPLILTGATAFRWTGVLVLASACRVLFAAAGYGVFEPLPGLLYLPHGLLVALSIGWLTGWEGLAFAGGYVAATQCRDAQELARVNSELLATQQVLADSSRLAERLTISRELHDTLGHHLTALSLNLELARLRADGPAAEPVREAQAVAKQLLADVRDTVSGMRQDRPIDLRRALAILVAGTVEPQVHLTLPDQLELSDPAQAHAVFRCVQEAITNVIRHSGARNLWINIDLQSNRLALRLRDDGHGAKDVAPGQGLTGMRERFVGAGGGLEVESTPGQGFCLRAWLPAPGEPT